MRTTLTLFVLISFMVFTIGCSNYEMVTPDNKDKINESYVIFMAKTLNSETIKVGSNDVDSLKISGNNLELHSRNKMTQVIPVDSLSMIYAKEYSPTKTWILIGTSSVVGTWLILSAIFVSTVRYGG